MNQDGEAYRLGREADVLFSSGEYERAADTLRLAIGGLVGEEARSLGENDMKRF